MTLHALQDLFQRHREKATGLWKLGTDPIRTIFLDSGDIVFATSTHAEDRLTHLLVERGKLTQSQLEYAMANLKPGLSIGKNLIEMGYITQRDLLDMARAQVERIVQGSLETPDLKPSFEAKELDANVVRLPLDSPKLLLNGLLEIRDRERLLELLGPLNQVVLLQSRRLQEMTLPPDLAKLPPLLDGTHTLLELSRESLAEPLRLGIFALFLREMNWARLHEMPPLDRHALDRALTPELEPLSLPLPEALPVTVPNLFSTIEEAGRPTTNLEHLSKALDEIVPAPLPPQDSGFTVESGQATLPTPAFELPEIPMDPEPEPQHPTFEDPPVQIQASTLDHLGAEPEPPVDSILKDPDTPRRSLAPLLGVAAIALLLAVGSWWIYNQRRHRTPTHAAAPSPAPTNKPAATAKPTPAATSTESAPPVQTVAPTPEPKVPEKVEAKQPEKSGAHNEPGISIADRAEALRHGEMDRAQRQGEKHRKQLKGNTWSLRLEIACMPDTIRRAAESFPDGKPDIFILPIRLRDGRTCYQLFFGEFHSEATAQKYVQKLPRIFREGGNRPKPFKVSEIPAHQ